MEKCGLEGCTREVLSSGLCHQCWSHKKYRLQYWRQQKRRERAKRKDLEHKEKRELNAKVAREIRAQKGKEYYDEHTRGKLLPVQSRFNGGKSAAVKRGLEWALTIDQYRCLVEGAVCVYCQEPLPLQGTGLDRKDNLLGYTLENSAPCCFRCNSVKGPHLTYEEMLQVGEIIKKRLTRVSA